RFLIQESTQFVRMSFQKPRIIPWLEEQINSQRYPGLRWTNSEQTQFEIPWKHGLRQDKCEDDVKIFEAWAIASGSYNPNTDTANPAVWKRNFRSALNRKSEIRVFKDNSSDSTNPHKIYEFNRVASGKYNWNISIFCRVPYFNYRYIFFLMETYS
ncbi:hypothetical protein AB205_0210200, partial [Aquarana catesbeiana]